MNEPLVVRRETQITAPPATVFAFLTDPEKIVSWMGAEVTSEAYPGGLYLLKGVAVDRARVGASSRCPRVSALAGYAARASCRSCSARRIDPAGCRTGSRQRTRMHPPSADSKKKIALNWQSPH